MFKKFIFSLIFIALISCDNSFDSVSIDEGLNRSINKITIHPFADTYVNEKYPDKNYEQSGKMLVDGNPMMYAYIKFMVPKITKEINRVYLRLYVGNPTDKTPKIYTSGPWAKKRITWKKRPRFIDLIYSGSGPVERGWQEFDITGFVVEGRNKFALSPQSGDRMAIASKEHSFSPELIIELKEDIDPPVPGDYTFKFKIKTDKFGSENYWRLFNEQDIIVAEGPETKYEGEQLYIEAIKIPKGKYRLDVYDNGGDGIANGGYVECYINDMSFFKGRYWFDDPDVPYKKIAFRDIGIVKFRVGSNGDVLTDREQQYLDEHNKHRKIAHEEAGLKYIPLRWNHELARLSYGWANHIAKEKGCKLEHEQGIPTGENLAARHGTSNPRPIDGVVQSWVNSPGHYFQLKWRGSHYVGCAEAYGDKCSVQACRFVAPGNCNGYDNWIEDYTMCGAICPPEGCYTEN